MNPSDDQVQEKTIESMLVASIRMNGKYRDCGKGFARIGRQFGRHLCGKAMMLHYDSEYHENDANFEACMPIRKGESTGNIKVRELPGGRCLSLIHRGPYDELGRSYEKIIEYAKQNGHEFELPTREVYLKGPGMIFRGSPKKYVTEIQLMLKD